MLRRGIVMTKVMISMIWKDTAMDTRVTLIQTRYSKPSSAKEEVVVVPNISPRWSRRYARRIFFPVWLKLFY